MTSQKGRRVLVLGATGMLGKALLSEAKARGYDAVGAARQGADCVCDLADPDNCFRIIAETRPQLAINAAAVIDLDLCEREPVLANRVNGRAPGVLAWAARRVDARFIQISTDHFYMNCGDRAHGEDEPVVLLNGYARSKFCGEIAALAEGDVLVLRTNITGLAGLRGQRTYANWAFDVAEGRAPAILFDDYFTSTIGVRAFSRLLFDISQTDASGVMNLASRDVSSKRVFVETLARALGKRLVQAQSMSVSTLPVPRANSCGLDVSLAQSVLGRQLPGLDEVLDELLREKERMR